MNSDVLKKLETDGIVFNICSKEKAIDFLSYNNHLTKLLSYTPNFSLHKNKYVGLDFQALIDLSQIDMMLRNVILKASLSIEHFLKVTIARDIFENKYNSIELTDKYLAKYPKILSDINAKRNSSYIKINLSKFHHPLYPAELFIEAIPFGEFVNFYKFYNDNYSTLPTKESLLFSVKDIRNASAHNNVLISNLADKSNYYKKDTVDELIKINTSLKIRTIKNRLKNTFIQDFVTLLLLINPIIVSDNIKKSIWSDIAFIFYNRIPQNYHLYKSAPAITQSYEFLKIIIDILINKPYNLSTK